MQLPLHLPTHYHHHNRNIAMFPGMQLLLVVVGLVKAQESNPDYIVTYNPDCLPYDGSVVPHCSDDPLGDFSQFLEHSSSKLNI